MLSDAENTKLDDASWHSSGDFPADIERSRDYTHIGMFLAWAIDTNRVDQAFEAACATWTAQVRSRTCSIDDMAGFFDEKLMLEEFSPAARPFVSAYYGENGYYDDLAELCVDLPSVYHYPPTWEAYQRVRDRIEQRYREFSATSGS